MAKKNISKSFFLMIRTTVLILLNGFLFYSCTKTETETLEEITSLEECESAAVLTVIEYEGVRLLDNIILKSRE